MKDLSKKYFFRRLLTIGPYEQDDGFRELLRTITQKGLYLYGLLMLISVFLYVSSYVMLGKSVTFAFEGLDPLTEIWLPDKLLIFILCIALIILSKTSLSLGKMRLLVYLFVWVVCIAMLMEDILKQDVTFTTAYTTIALVFAVVAVPGKGWHTALFTTWVILSTLLTVDIFSGVPGSLALQLEPAQIIYFSVIAVLLTGISSQVYLNRYQQYEARRRAEELKDRLEERAHVLEMLKEESEKQSEKILENEKLKDRFFTNISHEFRNPLTLLLGPLSDLLADNKGEESKPVGMQTLRLMQKNGRQLLQLINQLLDLSKIDAGGIALKREQIELGALVEETVLSFVSLAESRKIELNCNVEEEPITVNVDSEQIQQAISNLVSNALKFTFENGRVDVSMALTGSADTSVEIKVSDTGRGIPQKDLPHVFDRFYQADHFPGVFDKGTGIGLALVKEIVELHGGTVYVKSELGQGSEFIINLYDISGSPETDISSDRKDIDWKESVSLPLDGQGKAELTADAPVVLLVDDNPDILLWLEPHLTIRYRVIMLENSNRALERIREKKPDLIISDVMMPEPDGFELCRTIKEDPELNHIPIILLTARAGEVSRIEGLERGADDYISKPFSASELLVRAENLIELRRTLQEKFTGQVRLKGKEADVSSADARFLQRVQSVIEENMENGNFGVDWLAGEVSLSARQLQRKLRSITDLSAGGYIRMLRLERASQLLEQGWGNISEISYKVGFQDTKYFSRLFKQTFGVNPSDYTGR